MLSKDPSLRPSAAEILRMSYIDGQLKVFEMKRQCFCCCYNSKMPKFLALCKHAGFQSHRFCNKRIRGWRREKRSSRILSQLPATLKGFPVGPRRHPEVSLVWRNIGFLTQYWTLAAPMGLLGSAAVQLIVQIQVVWVGFQDHRGIGCYDSFAVIKINCNCFCLSLPQTMKYKFTKMAIEDQVVGSHEEAAHIINAL